MVLVESQSIWQCLVAHVIYQDANDARWGVGLEEILLFYEENRDKEE